MAYNNKNHIRKCEHAVRITKLYYEPGRQDRCLKWVWKKYIYDQFHVEYAAYLSWLRKERERTQQDIRQPTLFD
jgi:hypothetical protein